MQGYSVDSNECSQESSQEWRLLDDAVLYIRENKYREGCTKNEKRCIRRKAQRFSIEDGELLYTKKDKTKVRYVTDPLEKQRILKSCHQHPTSGHMGAKKTLARITEQFIWPGISKDAYSLVKECDICQRVTKKMETGVPELHPVPVVSTWHHIGIDFVGPLKYKSRQGNRYILTVSDYFSKFTQAFACKDKEAVTVCDTLFKLFMQFGIPKVVTSDQGSEFNNNLDKELMKLLNVDHRLTSPYHPQANGLDERFNQTLQSMIVKFVEEKKEKWEDYLFTCVYAYNTSKHESSKYAPFTVMFGWQAVLPVEVSSPTKADLEQNLTSDHDNTDHLIDRHFLFHNERLEKVKANIIDAQARQKKAYDRKRHNPDLFTCGTLVLKRDMKRKKRAGGKMDFKWLGPFKVMKSMGRGLYQIQNVDCTEKVEKIHGVHLKPYVPSTKMPNMKLPQCGEIMHSSQNTSEASSQNTSEDPKIGKTAGNCPDSTKTECSSLDIEEQFYPNLTAKNDCSDSPTAEDKQATDTTKVTSNQLQVTNHAVVEEESALSFSVIELEGGPGFDYSSPKHAGGYFAEFVPKGCTGILSPIAQQAKNSLASLIVSANRGKNLIDEVLSSPQGISKCKKVLSFDFKDERQTNAKGKKRKLITQYSHLNGNLCKQSKIANGTELDNKNTQRSEEIGYESSKSKPTEQEDITANRKNAMELQDESQQQKKKTSSEHLSKICQGRHKFLLEAKIAAYKLYDISFLTLARKNEWVSDEVITAYLHLLVNANGMKGKVMVIDNSVMNKICRGKFFNDDKKLIKLNIQCCDYGIGVFLQGGNHWVLLCVDVKRFSITYVDPKGEKNVMMYQLEKHWRNFGNMQYMEGKWRKADGKWKVITKPHCVQKDTVSCGVYVMKFAECIIIQNPLPNTISNINDTRKSMAITLLDASEPLLNYCRACGMCDSTEDEGNNWISCDYCDWWFHLTCVNKSRKGRKSYTIEEAASKKFCGACCTKQCTYEFL